MPAECIRFAAWTGESHRMPVAYSTRLPGTAIAHSHTDDLGRPTPSTRPKLRVAMRIGLGIALFLAIAGCGVAPELRSPAFDGDRAFANVAHQLACGPRVPGSSCHRFVADWIASTLVAAGWSVEQQQFFVGSTGVELRNIVAYTHASDQPPILLGTHYDTRPVAERDTNWPNSPVPGANDGASGVAVLLELARVLHQYDLAVPAWLAFFDGEDGGGAAGGEWILGSRYFAEHLHVRPKAVIIVDMVGDADLQIYFEHNSDLALASSIWGTANQLGFQSFVPFPRHALLDDHTPFLEQGIPTVLIIDFDYPYWHTTHDTLDKVSGESLSQVGRTLEVWLASAQLYNAP